MDGSPSDSGSDSDDSDFDPSMDIVESEDESDDQVDSDTALRKNLKEGSLVDKVKAVLFVMDGMGINLPIFLDALSWGDTKCTLDPKIRFHRTSLLNSIELPLILSRWLRPPRPPKSKKARPKGAKNVMQDFAVQCTADILEKELESLATVFSSPAGQDITEKELTGTSMPGMASEVKTIAPRLWLFLMRLARSAEQQRRTPSKDPQKVRPYALILTIIAIFSYTRSHHRGRLQKLFAIYFKFKGLTAKGFDTLHAIGLTMSSRWTSGAVDRISAAAMNDMRQMMEKFPWLMSYDNALISFRTFSPRVDKNTLLGSGTAGTVYIKRGATALPPTANRALQELRAKGMQNPLTAFDIFEISEISAERRHTHTVHIVLRFLFDSPDFDFETYSGREHLLLQKPPAVRELPCGPDHITLQYLLGTLDIPEASYEDNARLILKWLQQLRFNTPELQKIVGLERLMAWVGDQLTVDRLRNLFRFRAEDDNSFERLDWLLPPPGWLHIEMAFANSIHKQHLGTSKGRGLSSAFDILRRKGLQSSKTQGPFWHDLDEALHFIAEAQIRALWLHVGDVTNLAELRAKSPQELAQIAQQIVREHASSAALMGLQGRNSDELKSQSVMFLRDVLPYIMLRAAVKHGDVGLMEDMIPQMLFRFIGGNNNKYVTEMLELLQGLHREWPPEVADFVRDNCWVINNAGRRAGFMPVDEAQEMNIKDIKVTHRSEGPNIDWKYLKKLHPAIHVIRSVSAHMESEFKTRVRGWIHTKPKKEHDLGDIQKWYGASNLPATVRGRKIQSTSDADRPKDINTKGFIDMQTGKVLENWAEGRTIERSTVQDWNSVDTESD
ncbi:hypothetical protein C8J57DRAFT_1072247 [Mycena rebaudengoi]|nr:hypothetical protein C8J57DRAFT_1072247 [Mycena rebaudengoi]